MKVRLTKHQQEGNAGLEAALRHSLRSPLKKFKNGHFAALAKSNGRRALEMEGLLLSPEDEALVDERLSAHRRDPASSVPLDEMKKRLRSGFRK
jgi:hypothetical protein